MRRKLRIANALFWPLTWLSGCMAPVIVENGDYWGSKLHQIFTTDRFNDSTRFLGQGMLPLILWFVLDRILRKRKKSPDEPSKNEA